ncbi:NUDIX hydrolase domain-like protein [Coniella lustricola]|uniref:NUDIX hydrolase domain-like protein n=1 Tax=Coniella lustricola TaxID=2025994 RepID=A0A2T2ZUM6_9PEZI|nr:NUDIX hydrolase domain-like protein [Coniella lustricola]
MVSSGDRYVYCSKAGCQKSHWGAYGAAGLLLVRFDNDGSQHSNLPKKTVKNNKIKHTSSSRSSPQVLLQLRSYACQSGGTWAIPGGALDKGETPAAGALRETSEETCLPCSCTEITKASKSADKKRKARGLAAGTESKPLVMLLDELVTTDHGSWKYTTIVGELRGAWEPKIPEYDDESLALEWVAIDEVEKRNLHPGFKASWLELKRRIERLDEERCGVDGDHGCVSDESR